MTYPVQLQLEGRRVVVIGGGSVAERRLARLVDEGADLRLVSPRVTDAIATLADEERLDWRRRSYRRGDLEGAMLAFAATDNPEVNRAVADEAESRDILISVADRSAESDLSIPAVAEFEHLRLAIDTYGGSPALSAALRRYLEDELDDRWSVVAGILARMRDDILDQFEVDNRRRLVRELVATRPHSSRHDELLRWLTEALERVGLDHDALDWRSYLPPEEETR